MSCKNSVSRKIVNRNFFFIFPPFVMYMESFNIAFSSFVSCLMSDGHYFSLGSYPGKVFRRLNR